MVRRTCTAIAVLAQADTQLSPIGVTWGSAALGPCSLRIGSQELTVRHGPIVPRCPGNGPQTPLSRKQKGETGRGLVRNRTRVNPSPLVFVRLPSHRPKPLEPTSAPTSTRDEPHVGTHICARPLKYTNPEFLERSPPAVWFARGLKFMLNYYCETGMGRSVGEWT